MKKILPIIFFIGFSIATLAQDSFSLSPESTLTIDGTSTAHSWTVAANKVKGSLTAQKTSLVAINFEVAIADIISERGAAMDKKMHEALKKEEHPKVSFEFEQVKNTTNLIGMLSIAGIEKRVEIDAEISFNVDTARIKGEKKIILQDFEMEPPSAMFGQIVVGDEVTVKFDLVFEKG